jgi:kinesin family protein 2/24
MIANISPCASCCEHTLNTLRYADRVKELKKEKNDTNVIPNDKEEVMNQMMMPRQHSKIDFKTR